MKSTALNTREPLRVSRRGGIAFQKVPSGAAWKMGSRCETGTGRPGEGPLGLRMGARGDGLELGLSFRSALCTDLSPCLTPGPQRPQNECASGIPLGAAG